MGFIFGIESTTKTLTTPICSKLLHQIVRSESLAAARVLSVTYSIGKVLAVLTINL